MLKTDKNSMILAVLIMLQPVLDICSFFAIEYGMTAITSAVRLVIFAAIMVYAFLLSDKKKAYYIFAAVAGIYFVIRALLCARDGYELVSDVNGFLRTIQMPALTLAFITLFQRSKKFPEKMGKYFAINYVTIGISVLLSFLVGDPEYTYYPDIGIKGWFYTGNSQSCILTIMALPALCYFYRENKKLLFVLTLSVALVQMFFFGTLVTLWSIFLVCAVFLVLMIWNREKKWVMMGAVAVALIATAVAYPYSYSVQVSEAEGTSQQEWQEFLENQDKDPDKDPEDTELLLKDTILEPLVERFGYENVLAVYGGEIDASELMDNRQLKINFGKLVMQEQDIWSLLFGFEDRDMYIGDETYDPENDFPAVFFFYGIVGVCLYIVFLGYFAWILLKDIFRSLKKLPVEQTILGLNLLLAMAIAELSANVLRRPNVSIFVSLMLAYAYYICKIRKGDDHESECNCSGL